LATRFKHLFPASHLSSLSPLFYLLYFGPHSLSHKFKI
jgi:hypothetical protein